MEPSCAAVWSGGASLDEYLIIDNDVPNVAISDIKPYAEAKKQGYASAPRVQTNLVAFKLRKTEEEEEDDDDDKW